MTAIVVTHAEVLGVVAVCTALGIARASFYRWLAPQFGPHRPRPSPRALSVDERQQVLDVLHEDRFMDLAPAEIYATLLDDGRYLCSERTMYGVLEAHDEVREVGELCDTRSRSRSVVVHCPACQSTVVTRTDGR